MSYTLAILTSARADLLAAKENLKKAQEAEAAANVALQNAAEDALHYSNQISEIVNTIKTLEGATGYKPMDNAEKLADIDSAPTIDAPDYSSMTGHAALRAFFFVNNNKPATVRQMSEATGVKMNYVQTILWNRKPEFVKKGRVSTSGAPAHLYSMADDYYSRGWTTYGNK